MEAEKEKKNKRIAFWVTLGIHGVLLLLFILVMAWRVPDPPIPQYGIMVDFGVSESGSGSQPVTSPSPVNNPDPTPQQSPEPTPEPVVEEPVEAQPQPTPTPTPVSQAESPDVVPETKPQTTQTPPVQETPPDPKPVINQNALLGPTSGGGGSQGDDQNAAGDKGNPDGGQTDNYDGVSGGGSGDGLDIPGWEWEKKPEEPKNLDARKGYVLFKIVSDQNGKIISVTTVEGTVGPKDERALRDAILYEGKLRPEAGRNPSAGGVGFFRFVINAN